MDFFGRQAESRRASRRLVALFVVAVAGVVIAVNAVVLTLIAASGPHYEDAIPDGSWMSAHPGAVFWTTMSVLTIIGMASLYKTSSLSAGGGVVARSLGAARVDADTNDPAKRRLLNVVEEMAIASGVPMPEVYVLEQETAINAFAAGHNAANAAITVTRGALDTLNRVELQGVIAHEFSHILNGDMRLNIRLMGLLFGLLVVAMMARFILRHAPHGGRKGGSAIFLAAFAVLIIGYVGLFCGRIIQAAVSRRRESLADASAVQFTRDPLGLRGALMKIGANETGSLLSEADADEVAHMLFAPGMDRWFATHPPLIERIKAIDPRFQPSEFDKLRARLAAEREQSRAIPEKAQPTRDRLQAMLHTAVSITPQAVTRLVGTATSHVEVAQQLRQSLPAAIGTAAQQTATARALFLALALDAHGEARTRQLAFIANQLGADLTTAIKQSLPVADQLNAAQKLPALLRLFASLRQLPRLERQQMLACLNAMAQREGQVSVHAYAIRKLAQVHLRDDLHPAVRPYQLSIAAVASDLQVLFAVLAWCGSDDATAARRAYEAGMSKLLPNIRPAYQLARNWPALMDVALTRLDRLAPAGKEQIIDALVSTVAHDQVLRIDEAELLRTICATVHCPLPPLLGS